MATTWKRALNAARETIGKEELDKEPTKKWWASVLLAEHSPIRLVEYDFKWNNIKTWVTTHLVRHHIGCEKFVHSQRQDRRDNPVPRDEMPQGSLNDMMMSCNAQSLINISRKRLCGCASTETREAWKQVREAIRKIDPVMADKMVPDCAYRGFCPELSCCGFIQSKKYQEERNNYLKKDYEGRCGEDIVKIVADKLIGTDILGLDTNGQWYDSIKNGGKPIKTPKLFR